MFGRSTAPQQVPSLPASDVIERWVIHGFGGRIPPGPMTGASSAMPLGRCSSLRCRRQRCGLQNRWRQRKVTGSHEPVAVPARMGSTKLPTTVMASASVCSVRPRTLRASIG